MAKLLFTCSDCQKTTEQAISACSVCSCTLFKVARLSLIDQPAIEDPDNQVDPYRKKKNSPEQGTQFNNFGSEESQTSTIGGPNDRPPYSPYDSNPDGRPLPSDGGDGDHFSHDSYTSQVADTSPLKQPTNSRDISPFNYMRSLTKSKQDDPYEEVWKSLQKRKKYK